MNNTKIEYLDYTWNITHGCSIISSGCKNCYAKRMAHRLAAMGAKGYNPDHPFRPTFCDWKLSEPEKIKKPSRIGVSFMGDLFHKDISFSQIDIIMNKIRKYERHTFLILTKRPKRMFDYFRGVLPAPVPQIMPFNVWLGVTAENQEQADKRIPVLLQIPANVRFISIEPMLESIRLPENFLRGISFDAYFHKESGMYCNDFRPWVVCGPETGSGARLCKPEWIENLYRQCRTASVPFFDKRKKGWIAREYPKKKEEI